MNAAPEIASTPTGTVCRNRDPAIRGEKRRILAEGPRTRAMPSSLPRRAAPFRSPPGKKPGIGRIQKLGVSSPALHGGPGRAIEFTYPKFPAMMKPKPAFPAREPTEAEIRHAAYLIWVEDGRPDGRELEHWLTAREMLRHRKGHGAHPVPRVSPAPTAAPAS